MPDDGQWKILLVDDDKHSRQAMADWLENEGFQVLTASDGKEAAAQLRDGAAVVVTDLRMPHIDGLELLRLVKEKAPHAAVIVITAHATVDTAVAALKEGAFDYLTKPVKPKELSHCVRTALAERPIAMQVAGMDAQLREQHGFADMVGDSAVMREVFEKIKRASETRSTVLITGESGTGKELVVRALHFHSSRREKPFVAVNCAAIPESLIESELFGHEKGAFTGATTRRSGLFEAAEGGTLFIDEIAEMKLGLQSKLLRAIETKKIMPVGSPKEVDVDIRLVAASNRILGEEVKKKKFREDLYYRLKVIEINLPPLRERAEDVPLLVNYFLDQIAKENDREICEIAPDVYDVLMSYHWPGNVRELRNTLEGIVVLLPHDRIEVKDLPPHIRGAASAQIVMRAGMSMSDIEKEAIRRTLEQTKGRRTEAAKTLGLSVRALQRKIKEYEIPL